jgi:hypothetical protein
LPTLLPSAVVDGTECSSLLRIGFSSDIEGFVLNHSHYWPCC